uniref:Uncharacterized protein n=1 Tax=Parascaris univalens TaxID=6257 RepID=A0A915CL45_PARUN
MDVHSKAYHQREQRSVQSVNLVKDVEIEDVRTSSSDADCKSNTTVFMPRELNCWAETSRQATNAHGYIVIREIEDVRTSSSDADYKSNTTAFMPRELNCWAETSRQSYWAEIRESAGQRISLTAGFVVLVEVGCASDLQKKELEV